MDNKNTSKIDIWRKKSDDYYANVSREQFRKDLETAGFKVIDMKATKKPHEKSQ